MRRPIGELLSSRTLSAVIVTHCAGAEPAGPHPQARAGTVSGQTVPRCVRGGSQVRRTRAMEPTRLHGPSRPEPAEQPLPAAGARCCAPGAVWGASGPELTAGGRLDAPEGRGTGHGTAGRPSTSRRAHWRTAGRGLVTGGLILCGWLAASTGHAYAAQVTTLPASHGQPHGRQADIVTSVTAASQAAASRLLRPVVHLTGARARQWLALRHPASALLAVPGFAGAGAGNQNRAATALAAGCLTHDPVTALASRVAGLATSVLPGPVRSLADGLRAGLAGPPASGARRRAPDHRSSVHYVHRSAHRYAHGLAHRYVHRSAHRYVHRSAQRDHDPLQARDHHAGPQPGERAIANQPEPPLRCPAKPARQRPSGALHGLPGNTGRPEPAAGRTSPAGRVPRPTPSSAAAGPKRQAHPGHSYSD
jgi:hypothetical protein